MIKDIYIYEALARSGAVDLILGGHKHEVMEVRHIYIYICIYVYVYTYI